MRILVTGGAGYVGSHVLLVLRQAGHDAVVVDDLSAGHAAAVLDAPLVVGDFADPGVLDRAAGGRAFDGVVHLAAHSLVGESVEKPAKYYANNVGRGVALLEEIRRRGWGGMVLSSTAAVYGEPRAVPIEEDHPTVPTNPYGETKRALESALASWRVAHGLPFVSLRYFNAAGAAPESGLGEDHGIGETHLIPNVLRAALDPERTVNVFGTDYPTGDGTAVRDYVHVLDLAAAHLAALERLVAGRSGVFNLGNGEGFSVREVIDVCARVSGRPLRTREAPRRPGDPAVLVASSARARAELGWQPRHAALETIVRSAWEWHRAHPDGYPD